ncbi:hypothetical protein [Burkholderia contaminans]|uniref:hypothetical protein n=1 Tax=Burkholderia contaminans TaxID=488447 RepID=UPI000F5893F5|nr:hypothetical protein [Burkholderia contaminans]RQS87469.1 hypothetical protein DF035_38560 [Burkholderia contaminans]
MHAKKRDNRFSLYRSQYVRKGIDGNTHGYSTQEFVGSLPADALEIPAGLAAKLSPQEMAYLENKVILPARQAAEQSRRLAEEEHRRREDRERDPRWRLDDALKLLVDAGRLVSEAGLGIDAAKVNALGAALETLAVAGKVRRDPLDAVLVAVASATAAVKAEHYGPAPAGNVRETDVYRRWRSIAEAVDSGKDSLLKALQAKGWARVRG